MDENELNNLLQKYTEGLCTPDEIALVETWFNRIARDTPSMGPVTNHKQLGKSIWESLGIPGNKPRRFPVYIRYAAAILVIAGITSAWYYSNKHTPNTYVAKPPDIMPGSNKATLTLANGKVISLTNTGGSLTNGSHVLITNNATSGVVTYKFTGRTASNRPDEVNTISTPRGGQYQLILEDGTRVYLNSASTLRFNAHFATGERKVSLTGEAYFEVAKDAKRPFLVTTKGQQLKVLGTHFNVSAYPDETIKTTLAEGSVQLTSSSSLQKQTLKPDQQAVLLSNGYNVIEVNASDEIAWKDGLFVFKNTPLHAALQQISRWYNVEVDYDNLPDVKIEAQVLRSLNLQQVMELLEVTSGGIKFNVNGRRLSVQKK